ncbi:MAG TPA: peptide ABC transporter substrate-binding protein [Firmicutes bacterium]|jgi:oligopeptide transport system substrate-binding protein|nr:peptide ABC transporter substrate-binding protein [Bacillota bacterium]
MKKAFKLTAFTLILLLIFTMGFQVYGKSNKTMTVSFQTDITTLDPAIGYDWQNWSIIKSMFNGLMDYKPGTTQLIPDLAASYTVSPDGKTYTFKLRQHVTFGNGREVTASDVKYSLERVLDPQTQSPGSGFYTNIAGADEFSAGKAKTVTGITVPDKYTVKFTLVKPNAAFLHTMALNFAFVVPKEAVAKYGKDFGHHPVGTGAFYLKEWVLGQRLVLAKNPHYHVANQPLLDEIVFQIGLDPTVALLKLQHGEIDLLGDGIPSSRFVEVMKDPKLKKLIVEASQLQTGYVTINTQMKPFDNVKVRQALNMAVNKPRIIQVINGRASVANQILPPLMPGYDPSYKGYPYDPAGAKKLLAEAGFPNGFSTVLYANNVDPNPRIAQMLQQDLANIGIKVELKTLAQSTVIEAGGTKATAPLVWSGGMAWIADYPDPNDFYWPILGSASAAPGGWNWAWYAKAEFDKRAESADVISDPAQQGKRIKLWQGIFTDIMKEDAPWIPIFNEKRYALHSARIGGANALFADPIHIPVYYNGVYAK